MRETNFIRQNKKKWKKFEQILSRKKKDPDSLSSLFIQITDDLSYSRTFYPNRSVRVYLNNIARKVFYSIYKNKKSRENKFVKFWQQDLPQVLYHSQRELLISFLVFILAAAIGAFSSANDPEFYRLILGDSYVEMTKENIRSGDPMRVYKEGSELDMFLAITINNIRVALMTFVFGVVLAIGSIAILMYNGIMVGSFQYFFYDHGYFRESFLTIWMHGTLEISAIIIAGAAGLVLGRGLVFPGTYSRMQAFQVSARKGIQIMIGLLPIFAFAAFIEGFLTRYTELPDFARLGVILFSLFFIIGYFVIYPRRQAAKGAFKKPLDQMKLPNATAENLDFENILTNGQIITNVFVMYRKYFKPIFLLSFFGAILYSISAYFLIPEDVKSIISLNSWYFQNLPQYFNYHEGITFLFPNIIIFSLNVFLVYYLLRGESRGIDKSKLLRRKNIWLSFKRKYVEILIITALLNAILFLKSGYAILLLGLFLPFIGLWVFIAKNERTDLARAFNRTIALLNGKWMKMYGLFTLLLLLALIYFFFLDSPFLWLYIEVINWNIQMEPETLDTAMRLFMTFITILAMNLVLPLLLMGSGFLYFTLREIREAVSLKKRIAKVGKKKIVHGMEMEV